ncbi:hypothetical protein [Salinibacillus xinjiangensis]|uniref:Helix-turn-helix domain-containing protein n=1 Tax=Salinibacillus xinjiangensis TaxID=1229268 RepID=A0A6G1X9K1_9BACI|nr:hypothetical protein [Salinibacillus xinjiangensis]MRG87622.1 hypothetical protein [Salinibacillus xinjiangensis]
MNQLTEQSAFRDWLLTHNLSNSAILLWHTLVIIKWNAGSQGEFGAPNPVVQQLSGLSKQSISNARNLLLEHQ